MSLDSMSSNSYPPPPASQSVPELFTFVTPQVGGTPSATSCFASDSGTGSQQHSHKVIKKRGSVAGRRPRKPPFEVVTEPKVQDAPQIQRGKQRARLLLPVLNHRQSATSHLMLERDQKPPIPNNH
ncbi:hypothetical protein GE09DRAFT_1056387 [Coniochaeta sp. 2T2.1]|nr:hypothetical protein GE09DRAFT_1056387 [Coniochaeta sp. 2T2.1]